MTALRLHQPRLGARKRRGWYDPAVTSDGLTLDTDDGPVDLVAVERVAVGQPTPVTLADIRHLIAGLPDGSLEHAEPAALGLGLTVEAVKRAVHRRAAHRSGPDTADGAAA